LSGCLTKRGWCFEHSAFLMILCPMILSSKEGGGQNHWAQNHGGRHPHGLRWVFHGLHFAVSTNRISREAPMLIRLLDNLCGGTRRSAPRPRPRSRPRFSSLRERERGRER